MKRSLKLDLDTFGWQSLDAEARRQAVCIEDLIRHATLYYLADLWSGRTASRILPQPELGDPAPPNDAPAPLRALG